MTFGSFIQNTLG